MQSWPDPAPRRGLRRSVLLLAGMLAAPASAETTFYQDRIAPILDRHCVSCHGAEKQKGKLRLDSYEWMMKGGVSGEVVRLDSPADSELHRRITLPASDEDVMPADGKPLLTADEIKNIELWIAGGASVKKTVAEFPGAPALGRPKAGPVPLAPDWRPREAEIAELARKLGVRLVPRSAVATDGLVLRTASSPSRCDDAVLAALAPVASLIVEAELARTRVTDQGVAALGAWENLRALDLTRTAVTSAGLSALRGARNLEALNLTETPVDDAGAAQLRALPNLRRVWAYGSRMQADAPVLPAAPRD